MQTFLQATDSGLNEAFEKLKKALDGLSEDELHWRPMLEANTIDWLVLHMARVEDLWINAQLRKSETLWERDEWHQRIAPGIEYPSEKSGWGLTGEEIRSMPTFDVALVMEYYEAVRRRTSEYFANEMQESDLTKQVTHPRYDPVSYAWVLGHLLCEEAEHLGQIEYLRGMMRGINR